MRLLVLAFGLFLALPQLSAQERLPIIDMHLHAHAADEQGPPPLAICTPINPLSCMGSGAAVRGYVHGDVQKAALR